MAEFSEWVKRLGQQHWALFNRSNGETLCGRPMLGNNYARHLPDEDKVPCEECAAKRKELEGEVVEERQDVSKR